MNMTQDHLDDTLGCGPAPEGPVPPVQDPMPAPPAEPARRAAKKEKQAARKDARAQAQARTRRVGTFTMGIALIIAGASLCAALMLPGFDILLVAKLAPLVLVALGCEVLWWSAHQGDVRIKYDFLSMLVCLFLLCCSIGAAMVPALWRYYGPDRDATEFRLANELADAAYPALKGMGLQNMSVHISLAGMEFDPEMGTDDLTAMDYVSVNVSLRGPFEGADDFAESCRQVLGVLRGLNVPMRYVDFQASDALNHYYLDVYSIYDWDATAGQLAEQVDHEVYDPENDYWDEQQNYLLRSAYEEGYMLGCESAPEDEMPPYEGTETQYRVFAQGWVTGRRVQIDYASPGSEWYGERGDPGIVDEEAYDMMAGEFDSPESPESEAEDETVPEETEDAA